MVAAAACWWWAACWPAWPSGTCRATAAHSPADGFKPHACPADRGQLPGVILAALATLIFGVVLGPEAPLIAHRRRPGRAGHPARPARDAPDQAAAVLAAAGSFAAISTLLGSPLIGAFLLMEASGLGGPMLGLVLVPGPAGRRASAR